MTERTFVIGVGMTKFEKPGPQGLGLPGHGPRGRAEGARRRRHRLRPGRAGRPSATATATRPPASGPSTSSASPASRSSTSTTTAPPARSALYLARSASSQGGLADCALALGFEKMEKGSLGVEVQDRTNPMDKHFEDMIEPARLRATAPPAAADVRQRRPRVHGALRRDRRDLRPHRREEPPPLGEQPVLAVPATSTRLEDILDAPMVLRPAHQAAVLPDLRRRRRGDPRQRALRRASTASRTRPSRSSARR